MELQTLVTGLSFSEAPRWHDGRLYYSDFYRYCVEAVDLEGNVEKIVHLKTQPSGLGWLPDGRMLVVSMLDKKLLRMEANGNLRIHGDLTKIATHHCNDMVVDAEGRAYVGNFGSDIESGGELVPAKLALVHADGTAEVAAEDMAFPNGSVITPDGKTLIIGETFGQCLTAFDIGDEGRLDNRRVWADLKPHFPDGICLDEEGAVWVADPVNNCVVRVAEGGRVLQKIDTDRGAFACTLGGDDGKRLFICTADSSGQKAAESTRGSIVFIDVEVASA